MPGRDDDDRDDRDDDRPRRRRDDDDEEYDDRPRRKGSNSTLWIVLGVTAGACVLGVPVCIGLLLPAVQKVRQAAARTKDASNLKHIGLGFHNEENANQGGFNGPFARRPNGPPQRGLSWRVGLLPYIEQDNLYRQFKLDEAWDGPTNRRAADQPVLTYQTPFDPPGGLTTPYRCFYGGGAMFDEDGKAVQFGEIKDGLSNTLLAVMAEEQVRWAEPKELRYDPRGPLPRLGHPGLSGGANVLMGDGSVRFLKADTPEHVLRALVTRGGNEGLPPDW